MNKLFFLTFLFPFIAMPAHANRALMESTTATAFTMFVDTGNTQVDVGTNTYGGGISNVKLYVSSNLVVGPDNGCVIFSTGSIACKGNTILGNCLAYSTGSIACTGAISGPWTRSGTNVILTNTADNVGIGVTPTKTLDIVNSGRFAFSGTNFASQNGPINYLWSQGGGGSLRVTNSAGSTDLLTVLDTGLVGIGVSPTKALDIVNTGRLAFSGTNFASQNGPINYLWSQSAGGSLRVINGAGSVELLTILDTGLVGIGASPTSTLTVNGGVKISGTGSPATGGALCLNASNIMSKCTSGVDTSGNCTCP